MKGTEGSKEMERWEEGLRLGRQWPGWGPAE